MSVVKVPLKSLFSVFQKCIFLEFHLHTTARPKGKLIEESVGILYSYIILN